MTGSSAPGPGAWSPEMVRRMAYDFQTSRVLLPAFELDLFTALGTDGATSADAAAATGTDPRATDRLMDALVAMGLLRKEGDRFANTESSLRYLVRGQPEYLAGLGHTVDHMVHPHGSRAQRHGRHTPGPEQPRRGVAHVLHRRQAPASVGLFDLQGMSRVLDVGGGSGAYSMALVRARPGIRATVFDLPNVVPLTMGYVRKEGLTDRIGTAAGDYNRDSLGSGYDLVFLSAIIHSNSAPENRVLFTRCVQALNPGGQLAVQDFIMDEDRTSPLHGALFALNMLVGTTAGDTYTEAEVREWMAESGLERITRRDTAFDTTQIVGRKPS